MITTAVFDTKPYDREQLHCSSGDGGIEWRFLEFCLLDGTDCIMLSGESAMGKYPEEAVAMLAKIAAFFNPTWTA